MNSARATLADKLLQAADEIDDLSREDLQVLLRRAAAKVGNEPFDTATIGLDPEISAVFDAIVEANDGAFTREQAVSSVLRDWAIRQGHLRPDDLDEDSETHGNA